MDTLGAKNPMTYFRQKLLPSRNILLDIRVSNVFSFPMYHSSPGRPCFIKFQFLRSQAQDMTSTNIYPPDSLVQLLFSLQEVPSVGKEERVLQGDDGTSYKSNMMRELRSRVRADPDVNDHLLNH
jgi:hypothetical protein